MGSTRADLEAALRSLTALLSPCPEPVAETELVRISITTKQRSPDSADLLLTEYLRKLMAYPADIVVDALRIWPDEHVFFPAWAELREECEWRIGKRRAMKAWVEDELAGKHATATKPERFKLPGVVPPAPKPAPEIPAQDADMLTAASLPLEERARFWAGKMGAA